MKQIIRPFKELALLLALTLPAWVLPSVEAHAGSLNAAEIAKKTSELCVAQTTRLEQSEGVPAHLLKAISLAETGRWQKGTRENLAWPWTVTAHGRGQHFDSKEEALLEVEILMTEGVRNIDVGCMQINLKYHEDAFETLSEALDPKANTEYATRFLKRLHEIEGDWMGAVGAYHSSTPDRNLKYRSKLARIWGEEGGDVQQAEIETDELLTASEVIEDNTDQLAASEEEESRQIRELNFAFYGTDEAQAPQPGGRFLAAVMQRHDQQLQGLEARHMAAMQLAERRLR